MTELFPVFLHVFLCIISVRPGVGSGGLGERLGRLGGIRTEVRGHEAVHLQTWKKNIFFLLHIPGFSQNTFTKKNDEHLKKNRIKN